MKIIHSISQLRQWVQDARCGRTVAAVYDRRRLIFGGHRPPLQKSGEKVRLIVFVPTMGALHAGHMSLIHRARRIAGARGLVVVSIFVNPTQFNQKADLVRYPRRLAADTAMCRKAGVDMLFVPSAAAMYPLDFSMWVEETTLSLPLCGKNRPGHFRGVCTVVLKLFNLVQPHVAIFGQKDIQQALAVRRMARDLNIPVRIIIAPTVREKDGLAMSSRNQRLLLMERWRAAALYASLDIARSAFRNGVRSAKTIKQMARRHLFKTPGLRLDYLELVSCLTLKPVSRASSGDLLVVAAWVGGTRLIDNVRL